MEKHFNFNKLTKINRNKIVVFYFNMEIHQYFNLILL